MEKNRFSLDAITKALRDPARDTSDFDLNPGLPRPTAGLRPAAVLVPLIERAEGPRVILTRRAALLKHHPGQVAFPGGKQEADDASALAAALRESEEEIGLPSGAVTVLGALCPHVTVTGFTVSPFVGVVAPKFRPILARAEVDEIFEVPLSFALDLANFQIHGRRWQGHLRRYYALPYGPHYIWGATARMLRGLAERMQAR